ncbi:hypothetical protein GGX14DRAFT_435135 [Mycena pura]|uniref:Uncharacterized protein n=1 Tax=Mycena pura TaxID=153505 RepID=A0AAD6YGQ1_9AGAR|nr:hypothetical protein GGX14DRAFT_435135 [Mycena pura]
MSAEEPLDSLAHEERVADQDAAHEQGLEDDQSPAQEIPEHDDPPFFTPVLPEIPRGADLEQSLSSILLPSNQNQDPGTDKVRKRASNVLKLSEENEKLKAELKAMSDRLEAAERRREQLARKQQHIMEPPSS